MATTISVMRCISLLILVISIATIQCQRSRNVASSSTTVRSVTTGRYAQSRGQHWNRGNQRSTKSTGASEDGELQLLHIIFRHGQRTPADTYPKDPLASYGFEPYGWGQLTNAGKLRLYELGLYLRKRYDSFLGSLYSPEILYTQTTDVDRTKMSAALIAAGLYPPNEATKWGPLDWQPIPVNAQPLNQDSLLLVRLPCPAYSIERERVENSPEVQKVYEENKELFAKLSEYTGRPVKNAEDVLDIQGTLSAEKELNLTIPKWADEYYEKLIPLTEYSFTLNAYNEKMNRLKGGVLVKKILGDYQDVVSKKLKPANRKGFLYGGHDSTIANVLSTLKVWDPQVPGYAITILMELRKKHSQYGVKLFLKNETNVDPHPLTIPGCGAFCPLDKFVKLTKSVIPENWEEECKTDDPNYVPPPPSGP